MQYPTLKQIETASHLEVCRWWRCLPSPRNDNGLLIMEKIHEKLKEYGGFTPQISKQIGWGDLNYVITRVLIEYIKDNGLSYQSINDCVGALEGAKLEFYRRVAVPYENKKIKEIRCLILKKKIEKA